MHSQLNFIRCRFLSL